jgi:hypothetical protein
MIDKNAYSSFMDRNEFNLKMDIREINCTDGRLMEVAQDHVQWQI